jgi:drug/metabolite transporter (DMT)-like permease
MNVKTKAVMQTKVIGIVLVIIGIIMIAYTGFNYISTETVVDLGPIQIEAEKNNFVRLSPIIGGILLLGGAFLLLRSKKTLG